MAVSAHDDSSKSDSQDQAQVQVSKKKKPSLLRSVVEFVVIIVIALVFATGIRTFIAQPFFVPSGSMEQTLQIDDRVIAAKITTAISGVKRGEIMDFPFDNYNFGKPNFVFIIMYLSAVLIFLYHLSGVSLQNGCIWLTKSGL